MKNIPVNTKKIEKYQCPSCRHFNSANSQRCSNCWKYLKPGEHLIPKTFLGKISQFFKVWGFLIVIVLGLIGWGLYDKLGVERFISPPKSNISSISDAGDWAMFQRNPGHTGFAPNEVYNGMGIHIPEGVVKWKFETLAPILSSPIVVGDSIYLSTGDRRILSLDTVTGQKLWEYMVTGPVDSSIAVAGRMAFVGLRDGRLLALDRENGTLIWEFDTGNPVYSSPVVYKGIVYITSGSKKIFAIDAITGLKRWEYYAGDWIISSPVVNDEIVAFIVADRTIHVLGLKSAKNRLLYSLPHFTDNSLVLSKDRLFVSDKAGRLRGLDWRKRELFSFERFLRMVKAQFFIWGMLDTPPIPKGFVWIFKDKDREAFTMPAVSNEKLVIGSLSGYMYSLNTVNGEVLWEIKLGAPISAPPTIGGNLVLVGDEDGFLYFLDIADGEIVKKIKIDGNSDQNPSSGVTSPPVIANKTIYLTTQIGNLYAIK